MARCQTRVQPSPAAPAAARDRPSRRQALAGSGRAAAALLGGLLAGCVPARAPRDLASGDLNGSFDFLVQNFQPTINVLEKVIAAVRQKHPAVQITYTPVAFGEMAAKTKAAIAAGSGPDGFHTYSNFWRGIDAANMMLPLTPTLYSRAELERLFFPNVLDTLYSKQRAVFMVPFSAGGGATHLLYHEPLLAGAGIDARRFATLDAIVNAAKRLVVRDGAAISRAGLLPGAYNALVMRWIIDQGGTVYDEKTHRWTWQTAEAERAIQWLVDLHDRHAVAWREPPPEVKDPIGEGRAAMAIAGAFSLSTYAISHPDLRLADVPMPAFVPGKTPTYLEFGVTGWALSALLKPDEMKARVGAMFYRELAAPDALILRANEYTGALLAKGVYADPRFKDTRFYAARATFPEQVIARLRLLITAAEPAAVNKYVSEVVAGQVSVKAALAAMQQHFTAEEEAVRRTMG